MHTSLPSRFSWAYGRLSWLIISSCIIHFLLLVSFQSPCSEKTAYSWATEQWWSPISSIAVKLGCYNVETWIAPPEEAPCHHQHQLGGLHNQQHPQVSQSHQYENHHHATPTEMDRVCCLHGWRQTPQKTFSKLSSWKHLHRAPLQHYKGQLEQTLKITEIEAQMWETVAQREQSGKEPLYLGQWFETNKWADIETKHQYKKKKGGQPQQLPTTSCRLCPKNLRAQIGNISHQRVHHPHTWVDPSRRNDSLDTRTAAANTNDEDGIITCTSSATQLIACWDVLIAYKLYSISFITSTIDIGLRDRVDLDNHNNQSKSIFTSSLPIACDLCCNDGMEIELEGSDDEDTQTDIAVSDSNKELFSNKIGSASWFNKRGLVWWWAVLIMKGLKYWLITYQSQQSWHAGCDPGGDFLALGPGEPPCVCGSNPHQR